MKRIKTALMYVLTISGIALTLLTAMPASSYSNESDAVVITAAQADSTVALIDELTLESNLLRIDLDECRRLAESDSTLAAQRLELVTTSYEVMLEAYKDDRDNWIERLVKQPIVWFAVGAWMGIQAK